MDDDEHCAQTRLELGVYVLGAIGPAQRAEADRHLAGCRLCRAELAGLAGLPALLRKLPRGEVRQLALGDAGPARPSLSALLARVAWTTRVRRRRQRLAAAAVVIIIVVAAAALGLLALRHDRPRRGSQVSWLRPRSRIAACRAATCSGRYTRSRHSRARCHSRCWPAVVWSAALSS